MEKKSDSDAAIQPVSQESQNGNREAENGDRKHSQDSEIPAEKKDEPAKAGLGNFFVCLVSWLSLPLT
jgi:hypothetical protein